MEKLNIPIRNRVSYEIRSTIISVAGKIVHIFISGGDKNLGKTAEKYIEKTHTQILIDEESRKAIKSFKKGGKGIIISNHQSGVLSDYLPLFAELGNDILQKTIIYTGAYNLAMNRREFPEYHFRAATLKRKENANTIKQQILRDTKRIQNGGYIFIIPAGEKIEEDAPFLAIFQRMISESNDDLPILVNHIKQNKTQGYKEILMSVLIGRESTTEIVAKTSTAGAWKQDGNPLQGKDMRKEYNHISNKESLEITQR